MVDFALYMYLLFPIFGIIPLSFAISMYREYQIKEYLYFIAFWIAGLFVALVTQYDGFSEKLIYWQIREISILCFLATLYFQALRVIQFSSPSKYRRFVLLGVIWGVVEVISIFFWDVIEEDNSTTIFNLPNSLIFSEIQVGLTIMGYTIYSTSFVWIRILFGTLAFWTFFYAYFKVTILTNNSRVKRAHLLWKISAISGILFNISQWALSFTSALPDLQFLFLFIPVLSMAIIAVIYPEGYVISKPQLTRILDIYSLIKEPGENILTKLQSDQVDLFDYLMEAKKKYQD